MILKKLAFLLLLASLSACSQRHYQNQDEALAIVNDRAITLQDFQQQVMPMQGFQGIDTKSAAGKKKVLDNMVFHELIFQEALKESFHKNNLKVKHVIVDQYLKKKFQADIERINEQKVQAYYKENQKDFDRVRAAHILIKAEKDNKEQRAQAKKKITSIKNEISSGQISFGDAARKYSEDGTASKGGNLGFFSKGQMVPEFEKVAFSMENPGDISDIVETQFGYHLINLLDNQVGFEKHRENIRKYLIKSAIEEQTNLYKTALKNDNDTKVFYDRLPKEKGR